MLNFVIYIPIFSIVLVFAYFDFDFRFEPFKPKCMDKRMIFEALMINESSKVGPKQPNTGIQWHIPRSRTKQQETTEARPTSHHRGQPQWEPQTVVVSMAVAAPLSPRLFIFLRGFSGPMQIRLFFALTLSSKAGFWLQKRASISSLSSS